MGRSRQGVDTQAIVPSADAALLLKACPDLDDWPMRWQCDAADLAPGAAIVAMSSAEFGDYIKTEIAKWGRVVKEGHITAQ